MFFLERRQISDVAGKSPMDGLALDTAKDEETDYLSPEKTNQMWAFLTRQTHEIE